MSAGSFQVTIRNDLTELGPLAEKVESFIEAHSLPPKLAHEINVSLDEIITNTVHYGYTDSAEHFIQISCRAGDGKMVTEIEDDGQPFNPLNAKEPDVDKPLEEREIGGLGIFLVKKLMDDVAYEWRDGKNRLVLTKRI